MLTLEEFAKTSFAHYLVSLEPQHARRYFLNLYALPPTDQMLARILIKIIHGDEEVRSIETIDSALEKLRSIVRDI